MLSLPYALWNERKKRLRKERKKRARRKCLHSPMVRNSGRNGARKTWIAEEGSDKRSENTPSSGHSNGGEEGAEREARRTVRKSV